MMHAAADTIEHLVTRSGPFGFSGAVLLAHGEHILCNVAAGLADRRSGTPNTPETAFSVGSITKQFTATAIVKLAEAGQIDLHASLADYLPGLPRAKRAITPHHLLTHTAGLINYTGGDFDAGTDREHLLETVLAAPLKFEPGSEYDYSNAGYSLLALLVERVAGKPYETYVRETLWEPAGLPYTGYRLPDWSARTVARWYTGAVDHGTPLEKAYPSWNLLGNGGVLSNTGDLFRWWQALKGEKLLSATAKETLFTPFLNDYACGWRVVETERGRIIEHNGASSYGASAVFRWYVDHDLLLVVLSNALYKGFFGALVLEPLLARVLFGETVVMPPEVAVSAAPPVHLNGAYVAGEPAAAPEARFTLQAESTGLRLRTADQAVLNALLFPDDDAAPTFAARNDRLVAIFKSLLADDYGPLLAEVGDEARVSRYRRIFGEYWDEYRATNGVARPDAVRVLGTIPSFLPEAELTEVLFPGPAEDLVLHVHYRDGAWVGVSQGNVAQPSFSTLLQLVADGQFVDFDLRSGQAARLDATGGGDQVVLGGALTARREHPA